MGFNLWFKGLMCREEFEEIKEAKKIIYNFKFPPSFQFKLMNFAPPTAK